MDEHDVDNVNDDGFYILNGNDYDPSQARSTEEHQSAMNFRHVQLKARLRQARSIN